MDAGTELGVAQGLPIGNGPVDDRHRLRGRRHPRVEQIDEGSRRVSGLGLLRTVEEEPRTARVRSYPAADQIRRARFAGGDDNTQLIQSGRVGCSESRRRAEQMRHVFPTQQSRQPCTIETGSNDDRRRTAHGQQQLEHQLVGRRCDEVQGARLRRHPVTLPLRITETGQFGLCDHRPLRMAGRIRRVDDIRRMLGLQRTHPIDVSHDIRRVVRKRALELRLVDDQPGHLSGQPVTHCPDRQPGHHTGIGDHLLDQVRRIVRIHRHETRAGLGDCPQRHHRLDRARNTHGDQVFGTDPTLEQQASEPRRAGIQLGVAHSRRRLDRAIGTAADPFRSLDDSDAVRIRLHRHRQQLRQCGDPRPPGPVGPHPCRAGHAGTPTPAEVHGLSATRTNEVSLTTIWFSCPSAQRRQPDRHRAPSIRRARR